MTVRKVIGNSQEKIIGGVRKKVLNTTDFVFSRIPKTS